VDGIRQAQVDAADALIPRFARLTILPVPRSRRNYCSAGLPTSRPWRMHGRSRRHDSEFESCLLDPKRLERATSRLLTPEPEIHSSWEFSIPSRV
jgi:hypothetical protein